MNIPNTADIVIIGGGVMGASAAYHLAKSGVKNIVLLEKENFFGTGATGRCAGGVRYQFSTEINVKLSIESLPMIERFKEEIGQDVSYSSADICLWQRMKMKPSSSSTTWKCKINLACGPNCSAEMRSARDCH